MSNGGQSIKLLIYEALSNCLSEDLSLRKEAEVNLKVFDVTDEYGVCLTEIICGNCQAVAAVRQLAAVLLKQYIECHWTPLSDKFTQPEACLASKQFIRSKLPGCLCDHESHIRSAVAYAISSIAHWDWPEEWPDLFDILMEFLATQESFKVHGVMKVLTEFASEISDQHAFTLIPRLFPQMLWVCCHGNSIRTRARAIQIVTTLLKTVQMMNEMLKGIDHELITPYLSDFITTFVGILQLPMHDENCDSGLKKDVLNALTELLKGFPKLMKEHASKIAAVVWRLLTESAKSYVNSAVNGDGEMDDVVDSDGEVLSFHNLLFGIFDFVVVLVEMGIYRNIVKSALEDLIYYLIIYMQITEEEQESWLADPDQFVEDEDEDRFSYSVRISANDLLTCLYINLKKELVVSSLFSASNRLLAEAKQARQSGGKQWWKLVEATFTALGVNEDSVDTNVTTIDIDGLVSPVLADSKVASDHPFLFGRTLWLSSKFVQGLKPETLLNILRGSVGCLSQSGASPIRISAMRAINNFCSHAKENDCCHYIVPYIPQIVDGLIQIIVDFSIEVKTLALETMAIVIALDPTTISTLEDKISPTAIALFLKYSQDPVLVTVVQDVFVVLARNQFCAPQFLNRITPTLVSILNVEGKEGSHTLALETLCMIVRNCPRPLPSFMIEGAFPAVIQCTLKRYEDNTILQNGGECLRAFVSVALDQVIAWKDASGSNGLSYVMKAVEVMLNPGVSEFSAIYVGRLVSTLILRVGFEALGNNLDLMLRSILSKMHSAETSVVSESLIMVFAKLVHCDIGAVLNFLSNVPGPTGHPALEFVLTEWVARQPLFYGRYNRIVMTTALGKLLSHAIANNDQRFFSINVSGDLLPVDGEGIRTRSKVKKSPNRFQKIPIAVKILKLMINELRNQVEVMTASKKGIEDYCSDEDGDGDGEDSDCESISLEDALQESVWEVDDEDEDDPDVIEDPLNKIDMHDYLMNYLREFVHHSGFTEYSQYMNKTEMTLLQGRGLVVG